MESRGAPIKQELVPESMSDSPTHSNNASIFKPPSSVPQDISLILEFVEPPPSTAAAETASDRKLIPQRQLALDGCDSSDEEKNVVANVLLKTDPTSDSSDSESDSDSDISSSTDEGPGRARTSAEVPKHPPSITSDVDEDEEGGVRNGASASNPSTFATKNEVIAPNVVLPSVDEIGPEEEMELIGEVMSIVDSVVVVRSATHGMTKVLDTDSILVFDDRKVLGLVFETFGPLTRPMYSIRFPSASSIDPQQVAIGRTVYHTAGRSTFAYTSAIRHLKGSDASNLYDEEVGDEELEFSDDEQEQEYKRSKGANKRRRPGSVSRSSSVAREPSIESSFHSNLHSDVDGESLYGDSPYDGIVKYPSRPPPDPYDDMPMPTSGVLDHSNTTHEAMNTRGTGEQSNTARHGRDRGSNRGGHRGRRGSGAPGGRGGRGARRGGGRAGPDGGRSLSPTSMAIARVTGQFGNTEGPIQPHFNPAFSQRFHPDMQPQFNPTMQQQHYDPRFGSDFNFQQSIPHFSHAMGMPALPQFNVSVAPHINPRFAVNMGYGMGHFMPAYTHPVPGQNVAEGYNQPTTNNPHSLPDDPQPPISG